MNQFKNCFTCYLKSHPFKDIRTYTPIIQNVYLVLDLPDSYQYLCYR